MDHVRSQIYPITSDDLKVHIRLREHLYKDWGRELGNQRIRDDCTIKHSIFSTWLSLDVVLLVEQITSK